MTAGSPSAQEISDTIALRKRIQDCFELAAVPGTLEADMRRTLHFIVVGGGPTGAASAGRVTLDHALRSLLWDAIA